MRFPKLDVEGSNPFARSPAGTTIDGGTRWQRWRY
jgi:hypothetical protein